MSPTIEIPVVVSPEVYAWLLKYSDDQPRDEKGRWSAVPGGGTHPDRPKEHKPGPVKIKPTKERAFNGKPVSTKIKLTNKETDKITEAVVIQHLRKTGFKDAEVATTVRYPNGYSGGNHYAMDVYADHEAIELKGGSIANGVKAQQWRIKYGEESKDFKAWKNGTGKYAEQGPAPKAEVKARREALANQCLRDKEKARKWLEQKTGHPCKAYEYTCIINPDTRHVDLYRINGYHLRIGWLKAAPSYIKSYHY